MNSYSLFNLLISSYDNFLQKISGYIFESEGESHLTAM